MTPEIKQLAEKMAEESYPTTVVVDSVLFDVPWHKGNRRAYLAGFAASHDLDARIREEHKLMKEMLSDIRDDLYENIPTGTVSAFELIKLINAHIKKLDSLIQKIETK